MKPVIHRYKIPLLISLVIALAVIALRGETHWFNAVLAFLGGVMGIFVLDLEYIVQSYLVDMESEHSKEIKSSIQNKNPIAFVHYINSNEYKFGELSIRSALFQFVLMIISFYTVITGVWIFGQALILTVAANLIYTQIIELSQTKTLQRWFWIYDGTVTYKMASIYIVFILVLFVFQFIFL
jgi:hypothetical protein